MTDLLGLFANTEDQYGLPSGYLKRTAELESSLNPNAQNNNSSAGGLFQFLDSTAKAYGLKNKFDPAEATDAAGRLARDNAQILRQALGRAPTASELYLAHQQGGGGATKILANPDAQTADLVGAKASAYNGGDGTTAGQFANNWTAKFDRQAAPQGTRSMADNGAPQQAPGGLGGLGGFVQGQGFGNILQAIGASLLSNDSRAPFASVGQNLNQLQTLQTRQAEAQAEHDRQARQDAFQRSQAVQAQSNTDRNFGFQQTEAQRAQANSDRAYDRSTLTDAAKYALDAGLTPNTPDFRKKSAEYYELTVDKGSEKKIADQIEERKKGAAGLGLSPDSPSYKSYVLTGKMPREDQSPMTATDKKAIMEGEDHVLASQTAVDNLTTAKELSKKAFAGPMAGPRGYGASLFGNEGGIATEDLHNLVTTNAVSQLKTIFGGNPTEGERAVLLDIQGSVSKPDAVRQKIYDRGIALAQRRLEYNQKRVDELKGGDFYKPDSKKNAVQPTGAPSAPTTPQVAPAPLVAPSQFKQGQTATNPQTGQKLTFDGQSWVPAQ